jgi:hypothetical protein
MNPALFDTEAISRLPDYDPAQHLTEARGVAGFLRAFLDMEDPACLQHIMRTAIRALERIDIEQKQQFLQLKQSIADIKQTLDDHNE